MSPIQNIRPSPIAGLWYPGSAKTLSREIDRYIEGAKIPDLEGEVVAIIAPHAGYHYSGNTAGHAFRGVLHTGRDVVAVISPYHSYAAHPLLTTAHDAYETPLGLVQIDREAIERVNHFMHKECNVTIQALADDDEHSLEIELPFLQRALSGGFRLLPIMVHTYSEAVLKALGKALATILAEKKSPLMVASTDLSHFYPENAANQLDGEMLKRIASFSPESVLQAEKTGVGFACGAGAVATVLWAAAGLGANQVITLHHSTSAEQTGDRSSVVGYGAAVILKTG